MPKFAREFAGGLIGFLAGDFFDFFDFLDESLLDFLEEKHDDKDGRR